MSGAGLSLNSNVQRKASAHSGTESAFKKPRPHAEVRSSYAWHYLPVTDPYIGFMAGHGGSMITMDQWGSLHSPRAAIILIFGSSPIPWLIKRVNVVHLREYTPRSRRVRTSWEQNSTDLARHRTSPGRQAA